MTVSDTLGAPCWVELCTADPDAAARFYGELLGWTVTPPAAYGGRRSFLRLGEPVAGLVSDDGASGDAWAVYLESRDLAETLARVTDAGGTVVLEATADGDLGRRAQVRDPAGAIVGVWQPGTHQGFAALAEVGAPAWFESLSTAYDASVAFYREAFGWDAHTMSDTADFRYTTLGQGEQARAGIMDATGMLAGAPSRWQFYVLVDDAHETAARAVVGGGRVVQPVTDTPYGPLAALRDPAGVPFHVMGVVTS